MKLKKYSFPLLSTIFLTVIPLIFTSIITLFVIQYEAEIGQLSISDWLLLTLICSITSTLALTPPTFLALVFGYFLGWNAILPVFVLNMVAIFLINVIVKKLDQEKLISYLAENPKTKAILGSLHKEELKLIFFTKLSPVLPFSLTNLVFSLSGAKLQNILLGGFLGMIPRTILAIWTGLKAKEIKQLLDNPNAENLNKLIIIMLIISSLVGIYWVIKRIVSNKLTPLK